MQFSLVFEAQIANATPERQRRVIQETVDQAVLAEELGFDRVWCVEHHGLVQYCQMTAPETFLAYIAGRTKRIRVGHGVVCLPVNMNHPVRVAERAAMLDNVSGGRLDFGVGKGGTVIETRTFGTNLADVTEQLEEAFPLIPRMWREDEFEFKGKWLDIGKTRVLPKPLQEPHPPLFLACSSAQSIVNAGHWGVGALCFAFGGPDTTREKVDLYRKSIAERTGKDFVGEAVNDHIACMCPALVLEDGMLARKIGQRGFRFFVECIQHFYNLGPEPTWDETEESDHVAALRNSADTIVAYLNEEKLKVGYVAEMGNANHAFGTVDDARDYVSRLAETGADEIMFLVQMGHIPHEASMETIRNLGRHVIPAFR